MLQHDVSSEAKVHWANLNNTIARWLEERNQLISMYCGLTAINNHQQFASRLEAFCEVLVDYLSAGHFEIFSELEDEARTFDARGIQLVNVLYPYLEQSTEIGLWFNDRCD
ncbi:MAG: Rsd/AlgQ family anti-sigma factor, partial [Pseudomonadales bacterium]|nr:Rsd/AlgQ family anti-sigma factor [Pseudomonadales bacterium]